MHRNSGKRRAHPSRKQRNEQGIQLVELLVAVVIGACIMASSFSSAMGMYRASSSGEMQVLATNMAQQVIDNARNSTFTHLKVDILQGAQKVTQTIPLYTYSADPTHAAFPRPLLRDESALGGIVYSGASLAKRFNGTVTETLEDKGGAAANTGLIKVTVLVRWQDARSSSGGTHEYSTSTTIAETGIHN